MLQSLSKEKIIKAQCHAFVIAVDGFQLLMLFMFVLQLQELHPGDFKNTQKAEKANAIILGNKKSILLIIAEASGGPMYCAHDVA